MKVKKVKLFEEAKDVKEEDSKVERFENDDLKAPPEKGCSDSMHGMA